MADYIADSGPHQLFAQLSNTYTSDEANKVMTFGADGQASTGFTLPAASPWYLIEVYDVESTAGDVGYTLYKSNTRNFADVMVTARSVAIAEYTTFSIKATYYYGNDTADVYAGDETTALAIESTGIDFTPSTSVWLITDTIIAPDGIYAGNELDTDPFGDSSLYLRYLFNDDATDHISTNDGTLTGTGSYVTAFLQEGYNVATPSLSNYMAMGGNIASGAFSVSCFTKFEANTESGSAQEAGNAIIGSGSLVTGINMMVFVQDDGKMDFVLSSDGLTDRMTCYTPTGTYPSDGEYHHVVVTYDGTAAAGSMTIYLDGTSVSDASTEAGAYTNNAFSSCRIGCAWWADTFYYCTLKGTIDQFDIYTKELTLTEVNEIGFA